ncbi:HD-GYP domain-containing protein [Paenibacillus eucommiae]|uniref:HD-GYP domain-containing protein (C-di-GMP phosphodiesterase class II) n=1 Tax=Paenibacillus eucommiae TaxID=1355755 RepID=A0ABS4IS42_9BACL|nr:HD-GYP domain-containing protein [Paenibacillus eucommiae]MBP1990390.1 HD-GYP domain-containing protein (c-di-GMP phosphodiesterase class II) [Paenibacillus eucommiae]
MLGSELYRNILDGDSVVEALAHLKDYVKKALECDHLCVMLTEENREHREGEQAKTVLHTISLSQAALTTIRIMEEESRYFTKWTGESECRIIFRDDHEDGTVPDPIRLTFLSLGFKTIYAFSLKNKLTNGVLLLISHNAVQLDEGKLQICRFISKHMKHLVEKIQFRKHIVQQQAYENIFNTLRMKDLYTINHSYNVAFYSTLLGARIGLDDEQLEQLKMSALLHDVGKIGIPDSILFKPGRLTELEFEIIRKHPTIGYELLKGLPEIDYALPVARWHHERLDGTGYPDGLSGDSIPLWVRIVTIADAFDAMTSHRVYQESMPLEKVKEQMQLYAGKQFDEQLTAIFLEIIEEQSNLINSPLTAERRISE